MAQQRGKASGRAFPCFRFQSGGWNALLPSVHVPILALRTIGLDAVGADQSVNFGALETKLHLAPIIERLARMRCFYVWRVEGMNIPSIKARFQKFYALAVMRIHRAQTKFGSWQSRHGVKFGAAAVLAGLLSTFLSVPFLKTFVGDYFKSSETLGALRSLLGGTGSALIGAAAIAFSLIVFAMQTNIERMPHGLFRKLSSDRRLLVSFLGSLLTAIAIAGTSLIPDASWAIPSMLGALWGIAIIIFLFLYAYRRALQLINPLEQLNLMSAAVGRDLGKWGRLADSASILLEEDRAANPGDERNQFNASRAAFYKANASWVTSTLEAIHYSVSYAKRFAGQGDYDVTDFAFRQLVQINAAYCEAKRGAFVGSNPFFEMPGVSDQAINTSLEQLRQTVQDALSKGDERLVDSALRTFLALYGVYLCIEYPGREHSKHHALLASTYLVSAIETVIPHDKPDLMMNGVRLVGKASRLALRHAIPNESASLAEKLGKLALVGVVKSNYQPVTLTVFEQLADVTFDLLVEGNRDIHFAVSKLRAAVSTASQCFLGTTDGVLASVHSSTLGPYYSSTSNRSLRHRLTSLVNELLVAPEEHEQAARIISNITIWAHQIFLPHRELLLLAVQKRSQFTFDVIDWIIGISELLAAVSRAPACPEHLQDELSRHAIWLIDTLSWLPDDRDAVTFIETFALTENIFETARRSHCRGYSELYETCKARLLEWAKKGSKNETGWQILDSSMKALVALAIQEGTEDSVVRLKSQIARMLVSEGGPSPESRQQTAERLTARARRPGRHHALRAIDRVLDHQDADRVRDVLMEVAQLLRGEGLPEAQ